MRFNLNLAIIILIWIKMLLTASSLEIVGNGQNSSGSSPVRHLSMCLP